MDDELTIDKDGRVTYWDGTPVFQPAEGSRFEWWDAKASQWVQMTYEEAFIRGSAGLPYRYVVPAPAVG